MKPIKAAIFDIDGTLVARGRQAINPAVIDAIHTLQGQGIATICATGRAYYFILQSIKDTLNPDYTVTINGACVYDRYQDIVMRTDLALADVNAMITIARQNNIELGLKCTDSVHVYSQFAAFKADYLHNFTETNVLSDWTAYDHYSPVDDLPMGAYAIGDLDVMMRTMIPACPQTTFAISHSRALDIFPQTAGKDKALDAILALKHITWDEVISFGDSANDEGMLKRAGLGVAMGNGTEGAKKAANYVTASVQNDGIVSALKHFNLI